jgi:excinuclease ABC subunit C
MRGGLIQARREFSFEALGEDRDEEFLAQAVQRYYADAGSIPAEIFLPAEIPSTGLLERWLGGLRGGRVRLRVPRRGVKARFLETVRVNAELAFRSRFRARHTAGVEGLEALREVLGLEEPPYRIEAFDVSHLQGSAAVASMVVWVGGRPRRGEYRRYKVAAAHGGDDFASMAEIVGRRYRRLVRESRSMPDLILVDGGKGQLAAARRAFLDSGGPPAAMAALAKREEEIFVPDQARPIRLEKASPALRLLQQVRDEAHRFAITYHRGVRSRATVRSELEAIPGVGRLSARRLLRAVGSLARVRKASEDELARHVPRRIARAVRAHYGGNVETGT